MMERVGIACLVLALAASFAVAQDATSGAGGFCATAPDELLVALDGSWSLAQGPGVAVGSFPIPLPAHPPVAMQLEYHAEGGFAILSGQGQEMAMAPVATEMVSEMLGDWFEHFEASTEGMDACDWYALPSLIGSNAYALNGVSGEEKLDVLLTRYRGVDFGGILYCVDDREYILEFADGDGGTRVQASNRPANRDDNCDHRELRATQADMSMTISLKFDSPSSGRGMLTFTGESQGYSFAAWAPITMSR